MAKIFSGLLWLSTAASGQTFLIDWSTFDGGGGASSGGPYSLSGTIGQPDAGLLQGQTFSIQAGFFSFLRAVPNYEAPALRIVVSGNQVEISWPASATGFTLEESNHLSSSPWNPVSETAVILNGEYRLTQPLRPGHWFFRLRKS